MGSGVAKQLQPEDSGVLACQVFSICKGSGIKIHIKQRPPVSISSWKVVGEQLTSYDSENHGDLELTSFFMYNIVKAALQAADGCCDRQPRQFPASTQTTPSISPDSSPEPSRPSSPSPPSIYPNLGQLQEQSHREEERERMQQEIDELKSRLRDLEVEKKKSVMFKGEVKVPAKWEDPETKRRAKVSGKQRELGQSPGRDSARETPSGASKFKITLEGDYLLWKFESQKVCLELSKRNQAIDLICAEDFRQSFLSF